MTSLKIACSLDAEKYFCTTREIVHIGETDYTDVAAVVLTSADCGCIIDEIDATKFNVPIFLIRLDDAEIDNERLNKVYHVIDTEKFDSRLYSRAIEAAATKYEENLLPPFFKTLAEYVEDGNSNFDCPGHQGGQYFRKHPAGRFFYEFYGENLFRSDICNADVKLGDLLIHEGPACAGQKHAASVYNADKTYFILNGTSSSNKVAIGAIVTPGDLVLFDRNNHKSAIQGALILGGARPVYLETARNPFGFIGGIDDRCFEEDYIRGLLKEEIGEEAAKKERPFRLAIIQLGTYDGTIYNAQQVVKRIGSLCDYILFDSAWVGYEQFVPMMKECSPLLIDLKEDDPGILVTQSVHKQQAGFSQTSQIHKKDSHIKGQARYCNHKRFNNSFMLNASTSPFYPMFASLDVNAKMQDGEAGRKLWMDCLKMGIDARKDLLARCSMIKPFIPDMIDGKPWQDYPTEEIANDKKFFQFEPGAKWHSFEGYGKNQYFVDPFKFMLTTPGIDAKTGTYEDFGIPANILANYLRENGIIPEKCDLNSILFLMTPAETETKFQNLVTQIAHLEQAVKEDRPLKEVLPSVYNANKERYAGYTIRQLCQEMHDYYKKNSVKDIQKKLFRKAELPKYFTNPQKAQYALMRNEGELVSLDKIVGRVGLEGALPYPPGIIVVVPGEVWNENTQKYFQILEEGINEFPGFAPEIQGVYLNRESDGKIHGYAYVLKKEFEEKYAEGKGCCCK